jgi:hypothetical protein
MAKRKSTKDKQRSTKHAHKTKDRVTRTPTKVLRKEMHLHICFVNVENTRSNLLYNTKIRKNDRKITSIY